MRSHHYSFYVRWPLRLALVSLTGASVSACCSTSHFDSADQTRQVQSDVSSKLAPSLLTILSNPSIKDAQIRHDSQGRVQVYVRVHAVNSTVISKLKESGLSDIVAVAAMHTIQGWVKPDRLSSLTDLPEVTYITTPRYAKPR